MFECNSLCRMFMLCCTFDSVHIKKPATSKQGNSEVYVICCGYKGLKHTQPWIQKFFSIMDRSMFYLKNVAHNIHLFIQFLNLIYFIILAITDYSLFPLKELPKDFLSSMYNCSKYFSELQIQIIESNIERFVQRFDDDIKKLNELQYWVARTYINRFKIKPILTSQEIVGQNRLQVNMIYQ